MERTLDGYRIVLELRRVAAGGTQPVLVIASPDGIDVREIMVGGAPYASAAQAARVGQGILDSATSVDANLMLHW